jgi:ABC-2 type transport system permease protein
MMNSLWTTFRYTYRHLRWQVIGWGFGLALYGLMIVPMYKTMSAEADRFQQLVASYPPEVLAFFGADANSPLTPAGFLGMYAFSMLPIIVGIFAVIAGSGLIVSDEEHGRLDLIIAHPIGRHAFFWGRTLGVIGASLSIMVLGWLGFNILMVRSGLGFTWGQMAIPFLTLLVQVLVFTSLALMLSLLLPSRNLAAMISGGLLVISYVVSSISFMDSRLDMISKALPYHYYQSVMSLEQLNPIWMIALLAISAAMIMISFACFTHRDIRLSGEGSWRRR